MLSWSKSCHANTQFHLNLPAVIENSDRFRSNDSVNFDSDPVSLHINGASGCFSVLFVTYRNDRATSQIEIATHIPAHVFNKTMFLVSQFWRTLKTKSKTLVCLINDSVLNTGSTSLNTHNTNTKFLQYLV